MARVRVLCVSNIKHGSFLLASCHGIRQLLDPDIDGADVVAALEYSR